MAGVGKPILAFFVGWCVCYNGEMCILRSMSLAVIFGFIVSCSGPDLETGDEASEPSRPNIVLISMDTVRADHCSVYGYPVETTPTLERLAREGVLYERAYAPTGITGPSHATLFTGLHVITHGVVKNGLLLEDDWVTLAEQLSAEGYETAGFVSSFPMHRKFGFSQGFDHYDDDFIPGQNSIESETFEGTKVDKAFDQRGKFTTGKALDWLEERSNRAEPFFMFVHYFDAHSPYQPQIGFESILEGILDMNPLEKQVRLYDQEIAQVDREIGRVVEALETKGYGDDTIIIVVGDHGEGLMDHGYMLHAGTLYEDEVRVPMIVHGPSHFAPSKEGYPVGLIDVLPTVAGMVGYDPGSDLESVVNASGQEVEHGLDVFVAENQRFGRPMFLYRRHYDPGMLHPGWYGTLPDGSKPKKIKISGEQYGMVESGKKYIVDPELGIRLFFDLDLDPGETNNQFEDNVTLAQTMHSRLEQWVGENRLENAPEISTEADHEALGALGYVE